MPLFAIVQVDRLQLSYTTIGYLSLLQSLFWLLGNIFWGRLIDRRGGAWVLRANVAIAVIMPLSYIWAANAWMLVPAFIAQGIISAGIDLGIISTGIELADPEQVAEYSALQATIIGVRGILGPFIGAALVGAGLSNRLVFALGAGLIAVAWVVLGLVVAQARPAAESPASPAP
nr:MFS transporter [Oscillochloris sp. ZM17-4]